MIYVIVLLVIVVIVAVFLKKRNDNQNASAPKKGAGKTNKKAVTKTAARSSPAREEPEPVIPATTPIPASLRQKIEQQIQSGNFQSAEAQINQALKQDNTQHELYLLLLDLHLAQKDDFAIDQLIKHIHALKLEDIALAAETKQREYERNKQPDSIEFTSNNFTAPTQVETPVQNNTADFDALVQSPATQSFDDLQSQYVAPVEEEKTPERAPEIQPLDFNFSFEQTETAKPVVEPTETKQQTPLDFSFDLETKSTPAAVEENKSEPDLNFTTLDFDTNQSQTKTDPSTTAPSALDFNFEPSAPAEKPEFTFEATPPVTEIEPKADFVQESYDADHDPLAQSFPDLQQLDESQLNLDLAEQYIELGAYESARVLLKNSQSLFNAEQQQRSEKLLNQIAS